jgi:hypothetical protein
MANFEYKVVEKKAFDELYKAYTGDYAIEETINKYVAEGWEYQNAIVIPMVTTASRYAFYPRINLVFRRVKS